MEEISCFWWYSVTGISMRWWLRFFISAIDGFKKLKKIGKKQESSVELKN